jgi:hypothetical protein
MGQFSLLLSEDFQQVVRSWDGAVEIIILTDSSDQVLMS